MECKHGGNPENCICEISTINIPTEVVLSKKLVDQLFNSKVRVNIKARKMTRQIKKKDLSAKGLWPDGIKKIFVPSDINITPRLLKQLFKDSAIVDIRKTN